LTIFVESPFLLFSVKAILSRFLKITYKKPFVKIGLLVFDIRTKQNSDY